MVTARLVTMATEQTATYPEGSSSLCGEQGLAIRWVFPLPALPPVCLLRRELTLGRDAGCDVVLPSCYVSRVHARLVRSGPLYVLSNVQAKNGLTVDGIPVQEAVLTAGSVVRIGEFVGVCVRAPLDADLSYGVLSYGISGGHQHRQLLRRLAALAKSRVPVIVEGETGTGKELFSRAVHLASGRTGEYLAVNCAVYSKSVGAAELFGYRKGAFTGADQSSRGHVRSANGGTLVLDELLELAPEVQGMLLRTLENAEVLPLGETRAVPIDVRFVATTQRPLDLAVAEGQFRADLRARLEGAILRLPPLRECREIVPEMFLELVLRHAGEVPTLTPGFVESLCTYAWPLNVRQLDSFARRVALEFDGNNRLDRDSFDVASTAPAQPRAEDHPKTASSRPLKTAYAADEVGALLQAISLSDGNLSRAAATLGLTRQKAYRMLRASQRGRVR